MNIIPHQFERKPTQLIFISTVLLLSACPGFGDQELDSLDPERLVTWETEISAIMDAQCNQCHGYPASGGAPDSFRLDKYTTEDVTDDGNLPGAKEMIERIIVRSVQGTPSPMPPGQLPSLETQAFLLQWSDTGTLRNQTNLKDMTP